MGVFLVRINQLRQIYKNIFFLYINIFKNHILLKATQTNSNDCYTNVFTQHISPELSRTVASSGDFAHDITINEKIKKHYKFII